MAASKRVGSISASSVARLDHAVEVDEHLVDAARHLGADLHLEQRLHLPGRLDGLDDVALGDDRGDVPRRRLGRGLDAPERDRPDEGGEGQRGRRGGAATCARRPWTRSRSSAPAVLLAAGAAGRGLRSGTRGPAALPMRPRSRGSSEGCWAGRSMDALGSAIRVPAHSTRSASAAGGLKPPGARGKAGPAMEALAIAPDTVVTLSYVLFDERGEAVDQVGPGPSR